MFLPSDLASNIMKNTGMVNIKKRKVYQNISGTKYVKKGDKRVRVSRVFARNEEPKRKPIKKPGEPTSPRIEIGKVNKKGRKVFKDSNNRTYVLQNNKKVYISKVFSPSRLAASPMINTGKVDKKQRKVYKDSKNRKYVKEDGKKIYVSRTYNTNNSM